MSLERRIEKLEALAGIGSEHCQCHGDEVKLTWLDEGQVVPAQVICARCRKPEKVVLIRWLREDELDACYYPDEQEGLLASLENELRYYEAL